MTSLVDRLRNTPTGRTWDSVGRPYDFPQNLPIEAADEIERLREALEWMRDRDDRNGSLPEAYREKIDTALSGAADTDAAQGEIDRLRRELEEARRALEAAEEEFNRISCVPMVTETRDTYTQLELAKKFADRGAEHARAALRAGEEGR